MKSIIGSMTDLMAFRKPLIISFRFGCWIKSVIGVQCPTKITKIIDIIRFPNLNVFIVPPDKNLFRARGAISSIYPGARQHYSWCSLPNVGRDENTRTKIALNSGAVGKTTLSQLLVIDGPGLKHKDG